MDDQNWDLSGKLQQGRHGTSLTELDNRLYISAGCGNRGGQPGVKRHGNTTNKTKLRKYFVTRATIEEAAEKIVNHYKVCFEDGMSVELTNYGATIMAIYTPDKNGKLDNIVCGFENPKAYKNDHPYFGCVCGRYANRIAEGKFQMGSKTYQLPINDNPNHLHGGSNGFHKAHWLEENMLEGENACTIHFSYLVVP